MKTLIVEDVTITRKLLEKLLSDYAECDAVKNGVEALQAFKSALSKNSPYDLICLDIMMPGMSGFEVLKKIREIDSGSKKVKIIMTTSVTDRENVIKAIKYGCDGYLAKPYYKENLEKQLIRLELYDPDLIVKEQVEPKIKNKTKQNDDNCQNESEAKEETTQKTDNEQK